MHNMKIDRQEGVRPIVIPHALWSRLYEVRDDMNATHDIIVEFFGRVPSLQQYTNLGLEAARTQFNSIIGRVGHELFPTMEQQHATAIEIATDRNQVPVNKHGERVNPSQILKQFS